MSKLNKCKQCGKMTDNGTNFCSRKCRLIWVKAHNYTKKDWKRIDRQHEDWLDQMCGGIDVGDAGDHRSQFEDDLAERISEHRH